MSDIYLKDECYQVMSCCFEVYKDKGCGFVEAVYQECLGIEFESQSVSSQSQQELKIQYKNRVLSQTFKPDFICFKKIIVEIKAVSHLNDKHRAQVHNYLKATDFKLGLLVNFGHNPKVEWERIVH